MALNSEPQAGCSAAVPDLKRSGEIGRVFVLKPDEIGDFVLVTGALRVLEKHFGQAGLILAVSAAVAPLARMQFPAATVIPLAFQRRRKLVNVTLINIILNLPALFKLAGRRVEAAVCLRSMRNYLQTVLFYSVRARRYIACTNLLSTRKSRRRSVVEHGVKCLFRPELLPYPPPGEHVPSELEANRLVVCAALGREVEPAEIFPVLDPGLPEVPLDEGAWVLCPFSSSVTKDYPVDRWVEALLPLSGEREKRPILLTSSPAQSEQLKIFAAVLKNAGIGPLELRCGGGLPELVRLLSGAGLILTVDTATAHIACALRRRAVIVHTGQHPGVYGPYSPDGRQLWVRPLPPFKAKKWWDKVDPSRVTSAVQEVLGKKAEA